MIKVITNKTNWHYALSDAIYQKRDNITYIVLMPKTYNLNVIIRKQMNWIKGHSMKQFTHTLQKQQCHNTKKG